MADGGAGPSIRSVLIDTSGLVAGQAADPARQLAWSTPDGDGIGLHFFDLPPDIPLADTRGELAHLQATVVLDPEVAALPPFPLP